jgi:hypothetical protein
VLNEMRLNQVVVAGPAEQATDAVIAAVQGDGTCWCGPTTWRGRRAMRISISNWATTEADVDLSVRDTGRGIGRSSRLRRALRLDRWRDKRPSGSVQGADLLDDIEIVEGRLAVEEAGPPFVCRLGLW